MGACLDPDKLNPKLKLKNTLGYHILAMPDTPHLAKLTRNTLGEYGTIIDGEGNKVLWDHVVKLHNLQNKTGVHFANRLRKAHIEFSKDKQKVRLAVQVLSKKTANSLLFACKDLRLPEFKDSEPTADFLMCFNNLFDILNSRHILEKFGKAPISSKNFSYWSEEVKKCKHYIFGLKEVGGKPIVKGRRSAGFVGWLMNIESLHILYNQYVEPGHLSFIRTYRLSQDPLENFFSSIRSASSLGHNNNPNVTQFISAYKRLLAGALNKSNYGNCLWNDTVSVIVQQPTTAKAIEEVQDEFQMEDFDTDLR